MGNIFMCNTPAVLWYYIIHGITDLLYDIDAVVDLLSLKEGVEVIEKSTKVGLPIAIRYHYSCVVAGFTVRRPVVSTWQHQWVPLSDLLQRQRRGKMNRHRPH